MRVIGGVHRSRRLLAPPDWQTSRPMTDRVKQSLFDRLWSLGLVGEEAEGRFSLDLFCGTGGLGIEALSRGAKHCAFVEANRRVRALLEKNLAELELADRATVIGMDVLTGIWLNLLPRSQLSRLGAIFCDPPYQLTRSHREADRLANSLTQLAAMTPEEAVLIIRIDDHTEPINIDGWNAPEMHRYGSMVLCLYTHGA